MIDIAARAVHIAGITTSSDATFMAQIARNLTDCVDDFLRGKLYLIIDRDTKFASQCKDTLQQAGVEVVLTSFQASPMNSFAERFVRSIKHECLNHLILVGKNSLRRSVSEFVEHCQRERPHQGLGNELIDRQITTTGTGKVVGHE